MNSELNANMIGLIMLVGFLISVAYMVSRAVKAQQDLGRGFIKHFVHQEMFWLAMSVFLLMLGEAAFVATFHPPDLQDHIPAAPRFIGHFGINFVGYILVINAPKKWMELIEVIPPFGFGEKGTSARKKHFAKLRKDGVTAGRVVLVILYAVMATIISIMLPAINVYILASGLEQSVQLDMMIRDMFGSLNYQDIPREVLRQSKLSESIQYLPKDYSPYNDMRYPLQIVIAMAGVHYPLALLKGLASSAMGASSHILDTNMDKPETKGDKNKSSNGEKESRPAQKHLGKLLSFYGYSGSKLEDKVEECMEGFGDVPERKATTFTNKLLQLSKKIDEFENTKDDIGYSKATKKERTLKEDVRRILRGSPSSGEGLGVTLSRSFLDE